MRQYNAVERGSCSYEGAVGGFLHVGAQVVVVSLMAIEACKEQNKPFYHTIILRFSLVIIILLVPHGRQAEQMMPRICAHTTAMLCCSCTTDPSSCSSTCHFLRAGEYGSNTGGFYERETTRRGINAASPSMHTHTHNTHSM